VWEPPGAGIRCSGAGLPPETPIIADLSWTRKQVVICNKYHVIIMLKDIETFSFFAANPTEIKATVGTHSRNPSDHNITKTLRP